MKKIFVRKRHEMWKNSRFSYIKLVSVLGREIHDLGRDRDSTEQAISAETETETEISVDHYKKWF